MNYKIIYLFSVKALILAIIAFVTIVAYPTQAGSIWALLLFFTLTTIFGLG